MRLLSIIVLLLSFPLSAADNILKKALQHKLYQPKGVSKILKSPPQMDFNSDIEIFAQDPQTKRSLIAYSKMKIGRESQHTLNALIELSKNKKVLPYFPVVVTGCGPNSIEAISAIYKNNNGKVSPNDIIILDAGPEACSFFQSAGFLRANSSSRNGSQDKNKFESYFITPNDLTGVQYPYLKEIADAAVSTLARLDYPIILGANVISIKDSSGFLTVDFTKNDLTYSILAQNVIYNTGLGEPSYSNLPKEIQRTAEKQFQHYLQTRTLPKILHADHFFKIASQESRRGSDIIGLLGSIAIIGSGDSAKTIIEYIYKPDEGSAGEYGSSFASSFYKPYTYWIASNKNSCSEIKEGRARYLGLAKLITDGNLNKPVIPKKSRLKDIKIENKGKRAVTLFLDNDEKLIVDRVILATGFKKSYSPLGLAEEEVLDRLQIDDNYGNCFIQLSENKDAGKIFFNGSCTPALNLLPKTDEKEVAFFNLSPRATKLGKNLSNKVTLNKTIPGPRFPLRDSSNLYPAVANEQEKSLEILIINGLKAKIKIYETPDENISLRSDIGADLLGFLQIFFTELITQFSTRLKDEPYKILLYKTKDGLEISVETFFVEVFSETLKKALLGTPGLISAMFDKISPYERISVEGRRFKYSPSVRINLETASEPFILDFEETLASLASEKNPAALNKLEEEIQNYLQRQLITINTLIPGTDLPLYKYLTDENKKLIGIGEGSDVTDENTITRKNSDSTEFAKTEIGTKQEAIEAAKKGEEPDYIKDLMRQLSKKLSQIAQSKKIQSPNEKLAWFHLMHAIIKKAYQYSELAASLAADQAFNGGIGLREAAKLAAENSAWNAAANATTYVASKTAWKPVCKTASESIQSADMGYVHLYPLWAAREPALLAAKKNVPIDEIGKIVWPVAEWAA